LILISVPAWQWLYSEHDRQLQHHRRYSAKRLARLLEDAGLEPLRGGGLFHTPLLARSASTALAALGRLVDRHRAPDGGGAPEGLQWNHGAIVSALADSMLRLDTHLSRFMTDRAVWLPGLSEWALCQPDLRAGDDRHRDSSGRRGRGSPLAAPLSEGV
jgi:hypothetical protein